MSQTSQTVNALRERAEREIALAKATGSKATASPDYSKVFITRRDGTRETVRITPPALH
ncbi:MAG TPA: hypothetical protein VEA80_17225 [Vitreimonas sp.]|uniref:hypothetical protein n=1 Tax=Vitreimonas sp. TaxID=3069702 RepID=UPI002D581876|nr:hypothetical protein [Vitreimonas sp.]HYD89224.1 hypothetical protein [Vitreimonas sp.]